MRTWPESRPPAAPASFCSAAKQCRILAGCVPTGSVLLRRLQTPYPPGADRPQRRAARCDLHASWSRAASVFVCAAPPAIAVGCQAPHVQRSPRPRSTPCRRLRLAGLERTDGLARRQCRRGAHLQTSKHERVQAGRQSAPVIVGAAQRACGRCSTRVAHSHGSRPPCRSALCCQVTGRTETRCVPIQIECILISIGRRLECQSNACLRRVVVTAATATQLCVMLALQT